MTEIVTLASLCEDLKLNPREAREILRAAALDAKKHPELAKAHKARGPWTWVKGSAGEKEARIAVKGLPPEKEVRAVAKGSTGEKEGKTAARA